MIIAARILLIFWTLIATQDKEILEYNFTKNATFNMDLEVPEEIFAEQVHEDLTPAAVLGQKLNKQLVPNYKRY